MNKFKENQQDNVSKLTQYVPVVAKVHGENHPEFYEVKPIVDSILVQIKEKDYENLHLDAEFEKLQRITDGYTIPSDTCETYEAVYVMLEAMNNDYNKYFIV